MLGLGRSSVLSRMMATGNVMSGYMLPAAPHTGHTGAHGGTQGHTGQGLIFRYKTII